MQDVTFNFALPGRSETEHTHRLTASAFHRLRQALSGTMRQLTPWGRFGFWRIQGVLIYAKIYEQIFDSSIAENYQVRHVFEDLLKLADQDGTVNRTHEAIARRTNVPIEIIRHAITELEKPDPRSQSKIADGARLVKLEPGRDWGWKIVNHGYYRALRTAEEKREADRDRQRKNRGESTLHEKKLQKLQSVTSAYVSTSASVWEEESEEKGPPWTPELWEKARQSVGTSQKDAEECWAYWDREGWLTNKGRRLSGDPRSTLVLWESSKAKHKPNGNGQHPKQLSAYEINQRLEAIKKELAKGPQGEQDIPRIRELRQEKERLEKMRTGVCS